MSKRIYVVLKNDYGPLVADRAFTSGEKAFTHALDNSRYGAEVHECELDDE